MLGMIIAGLVLVVTMLLTMARLDLLKFLGYAAIVDVLFTILMFVMFAHSFSGIVAGSFAGLFMTGLLYALRSSLGYKRFTRTSRFGFGWKYYPPKSHAWFKGMMTR